MSAALPPEPARSADPPSPPEGDPNGPPAAAPEAEMTEEELREARRYRRRQVALMLADWAIDLAVLSTVLFALARPLDRWLAAWPVLERSGSLRLAAFYLAVTAIQVAIALPLAYYGGYVLEHRFQLSTLTRAGWLWRRTKMLLLGVPFGLAMWLGLFWVIWLTGAWWWLVGAGGVFAVSVVLARIWPVVIEPLFYTIERLDRPDLHERLSRLVQGTGLSIEGVYRIALSEETVKANAQLAGLGRTRRVLLGDTLLDRFTLDEIEVIFAHEIGHHVFGHIRKLVLAGMAASAAGFWVCDVALRAWLGRGGAPLDYAAVPVHAMPLLALVLFVLGAVSGPLQNAVSRRFERQCDRYALERTGRPEAYRGAFRKLARQNKADPSPPRWEVLLFHSHPPIAERLALAGSGEADREAPP